MNRAVQFAACGTALALALTGCSQSVAPADKQYGYNPDLPAPTQYLLPPMGISDPIGWKKGETPKVPAGFTITELAGDLHSPRNVLPLPNGDVLVSEGGTPYHPSPSRPKDVVFSIVKGKASASVKAGNDVVLLRDADGDGVAEQRTVLIKDLNSPFGMAWANGKLYVAETDQITEFDYTPGQVSLAGPGRTLTDLPGGPIDHHWTKSLTISPDGTKLYAGVGSNSNIVENGIEAEKGRAAIYEVELPSGAKREFAGGLRNPNGLTFNPQSGQLFAVINERDELGNNLVPDYITSVRDGGFYGWPWSYYGQHVDIRVHPQRPDKVASAIVPDYSLGSHVAPLGLAFGPASLPSPWAGGAFIGEHGSWDRDVFNGYAVSFIPFAGGKPMGTPRDFMTGFITKDGKTRGRPVGVAFTADGSLLVADDVGQAVWRAAPQRMVSPVDAPTATAG